MSTFLIILGIIIYVIIFIIVIALCRFSSECSRQEEKELYYREQIKK